MSEQLPAVAEQHRNVIASLPVNPMVEADRIWTTIVPDTEEGKRLTVRCMQQADYSGEEVMGQELSVVHVLCHEVELIDAETSEVVNAVRTVLVQPDGSTVAFVSIGIFKALGLLAKTYGPPPWKPALRVKVTQKRTRAKRLLYQLDPLGFAPEGQ